MIQKHGLGRGLASLIPQKNTTQKTAQTQNGLKKQESVLSHTIKESTTKKESSDSKQDFIAEVPIGAVRANVQQPRMYFDEEKLSELTQSIKVHGVLQPLIATRSGNHYELIAGERRLRASKKAGLLTVPIVVRDENDFDDQKKLELSLIENIQRHDLNVIEEARSYQKLSDEFELSQEEIAVRTGKSRSVVANRVRLLSLPIDIQKGLIAGAITEGHAKVILSLADERKQHALYDVIIGGRLTVRQAENKLNTLDNHKKRKESKIKSPHARRLEDQLTRYFSTKVRVNENSNGGSITVSYFSDEDLKNILSRLKLI